jgi:hypothetical protein
MTDMTVSTTPDQDNTMLGDKGDSMTVSKTRRRASTLKIKGNQTPSLRSVETNVPSKHMHSLFFSLSSPGIFEAFPQGMSFIIARPPPKRKGLYAGGGTILQMYRAQ